MAKIGRNDPCHCGSGKKFKKCHGFGGGSTPVAVPSVSTFGENERLHEFYKSLNWKLSKCLEPSLQCEGKAIRAHSIQNARSLDLLVEDGHVIAVRPDFRDRQPNVIFDRVGRNNASTFTGMCAQHDAEIFRALDTKPFDPKDREQLFLLAYRSVTREFHAVMDGAAKIQSAYRTRVSMGVDRGDVPTPAGLLATQHLIRAFETYQYRAKYYDRYLVKSQFEDLEHDTFLLNAQAPTIAVSSLFSFPGISRGDELVGCALNIFPVSPDTTVVVASYAKPDAAQARVELGHILKGDDSVRRFELSRLILRRIENFVLNPAFFNKWPADKKEAVIGAFRETLMTEGDVSRDPRLLLF